MAAADFRFDAERLLSPISAEKPSGDSLRYEGAYDRIKALRKDEDPNLPQGVWKADVQRANWAGVEQECLTALETRSKDLNLAAWLTESWMHLYGFSGLREGLIVTRELVDNFWETLYPEIRDGDIDFRIAPLEWIDEKLTIQAKLVPLSAPEGEGAAYSFADWEMAIRPTPRPERGQPAVAPALNQATFQQSMTLTPTAVLYATGMTVRETLEAAADLVQSLDGVMGRQGPALTALRGALESILNLLASFLNDRSDLPQEDETELEGPFDTGGALPLLPSGSRIRTRAEAYQRLAEAADFLLRTEPHSPVPYLVKRAIGWGSLSLGDLLPELVRNQGELTEIFRLLRLNGGAGGNEP
jgi:type VI secretion system protein ImpA